MYNYYLTTGDTEDRYIDQATRNILAYYTCCV